MDQKDLLLLDGGQPGIYGILDNQAGLQSVPNRYYSIGAVFFNKHTRCAPLDILSTVFPEAAIIRPLGQVTYL